MNNNKWVIVKKSSIHNKGVFAKSDIPKNTYIIRYKGKRITNEEADVISEKEAEEGRVYLFELDKEYSLDGDIEDNDARYINHSCNPNAESINDNGEIWVISTKEIKEGEEITYDYYLDTDNPEDHPCKCGSHNCIGIIARKKK